MRGYSGLLLCVGLLVGCSGEDSIEGGDGDGDSDGDGDGDSGTPMHPGGDVSPADEITCAQTEDWDGDWAELEEEVLEAVNAYRTQGARCPGRTFAPTFPLVMDPALQCAARLHSKDMADRDFFDHDNPSGEDPWVRIDDAGFTGFAGAENISTGAATAEQVVDGWMDSPSGHCSNIMNPDFEFIGIGYYPGGDYGHLWTQTFGSSSN